MCTGLRLFFMFFYTENGALVGVMTEGMAISMLSLLMSSFFRGKLRPRLDSFLWLTIEAAAALFCKLVYESM